jgi:hypothetical protein
MTLTTGREVPSLRPKGGMDEMMPAILEKIGAIGRIREFGEIGEMVELDLIGAKGVYTESSGYRGGNKIINVNYVISEF